MRIVEEALTFDDVLLIPAFSNVMPKQVNLKTMLTKSITLNVPMLTAAMDTVTEHRMAIAVAQQGGLGIIHKNMTIEQQASEVSRVKKYESGVIQEPITINSTATIKDVHDLTNQYGISGLPVVDGDDLVGIVTSRDLRFEKHIDQPVSSIMTPKEKLVTVGEDANKEEILNLFHEHRIEKILVVNDEFHLRGMITVKDIQKAKEYPNACKDEKSRLRVGAAVGTGAETQDRVKALAAAGVDVVVVDTAHGHSMGVLEMVKWVKSNYPDLQVIGGNIATASAARALVEAGADAVKVGIGPGSICTTRIVAGVGVPQITAITNVAEELKNDEIGVIADGGIRFSGDFAKALASGAHCAMFGSVFAGTEEAPGEVELYQGRSYKSYRGMGSMGAMSQQHGSSDRYFQESKEADKLVPEGIEGRVPYKGPMGPVVHQMLGGLRSSMGYTGCADIDSMRTQPQFVRVTNAGMVESHVHDVTITKEAPNYRAG